MSFLLVALEKMDITGYCRDLIKILEQAENMSEKLTPLKLVDAWSGKGVSKLRVAEVTPPKLPREELERIVAHLLLQQYLRYVWQYSFLLEQLVVIFLYCHVVSLQY